MARRRIKSHRRTLMYIPPATQRGYVDLPSEAHCTGGLVNDYGKRLTLCRSTFCPRCQPGNYASHMARHATDSL